MTALILGVVAPSAPVALLGVDGQPLKAKVSPDRICAEFKARPGDHRFDLLHFLASNFGQAMPRAAVLNAVYGSDDKSNVGALGMCIEGARKSIKKFGLPYRVVKVDATVALVPAAAIFAVN